MNLKPNPPNSLSQADVDLLPHLTDLAETLEPNQTFQCDLEAQLFQAHPSNSSQNISKGTNQISVLTSRLNRCTSLVAYTLIAIAATLMLPIPTSGRVPGWLAAVPHSTIDLKADAQTIAQAIETGHVTVISDVQEYDETTQSIRAIGNATLTYPETQIQANANEIQYTATDRQVTLLGNVQIPQRGATLQGTQAICSLEQRQCHLTQE
ncbi:hypothetical protein H6F87_23995 [Cyanobacteria bacterium FACHB-502]|nr:hypothetical protein [Cyanobacteria bacterium FACHB-502]